ncbi:MATE family efflux transporter [Rhizobium halophytocola]|uniref:MATE family efflux protein n=1 Tax=Rhizobium halophytocola TaxID=735519 RepID=A0ABS4DYU2_9HYPH|nr:MATE family efflux transporter [Rhizobium halophytocola]MBP1850854.1 putative MATE family efflux protein [Rhizobium halophytocola]
MRTSLVPANPFLSGSLPRLFLRTALPIVLVMLANGLYVVVDAWFLGTYVGAHALSAVTLLFPALMAMIALQSLVAGGMASILARRLGAGEREGAATVIASARQLGLAIALVVNAIYWTIGRGLVVQSASGDGAVAAVALTYMGIAVATLPVAMLLAIEIDSLRCRGRIGLMTRVTLSASLLNIVLNGILIGGLGLGAAGSAGGSALAQGLCLAAAMAAGGRGGATGLAANLPRRGEWQDVKRILALGAPMSLGLVGISLTSATILWSIARWQTAHPMETIAAYGIVTRLLSLGYLPLMGLSLALQTVCGNNIGAGRFDRAIASLAIAATCAFAYCLAFELALVLAREAVAGVFTGDRLVALEFARVIPWMLGAYALFGPVMMIGAYFQAAGEAGRAALFGLLRPYGLVVPLTFALPHLIGETGIWKAPIVAECVMVAVAGLVIADGLRRGRRYGLLPT